MEKHFQSFPGGEKPEPFEEFDSTRETERHWPLITPEEHLFIEATGGQFGGFIKTESGRQEFKEIKVDRRAYYDEHQRAVIETFVATEASVATQNRP